ncbi:MAG: NADH-quinone oxidoreductase subunit A [Planctomycetes bacterium]|nr:NADH-quinone oxidoreductase subunit A [Planctomycetota bacterium]
MLAETATAPITGFTPLVPYVLVALTVFAVLMLVPKLLGKRSYSKEKFVAYECGVDPIGSARQRFSVHFYLVAVLFILFDIEAVFLFPWAISLQEIGSAGFIGALLFVGVLALGLAYAWRRGVLDWNN